MFANKTLIRLLTIGALSFGFTCSYPDELEPTRSLQASDTNSPQSKASNSFRDLMPEGATDWTDKPGWIYPTEAVAAANPIATNAGLEILRMGGNAVDASVCIQMVLTLVEPQSSGIGGGGFLVLSTAKGIVVFDGRETAPSAATEKLFLNQNGHPIDFKAAQLSSRSIGVPGIVAMLWQAHKLYGKLPWQEVLRPAIELADKGFEISPRLFQLLKRDSDLIHDKHAREYFYQADQSPWPVGHLLKNPELAKILTDIARLGPKAFYSGLWAEAIVKTANQEEEVERMKLEDLKNYRSLIREPLCFDLQAQQGQEPLVYRVCGAPPPSSGTLAMGQILGMLQHTAAKNLPFGPDWLHYYSESARLAFADRAKYVADYSATPNAKSSNFTNNNFNAQTWRALISPNYLQERAKLIGERKMTDPVFGVPPELALSALTNKVGSMPNQPEHGTSHISIMDRFGNAVAFTSSIESAFGVHRMVNSGRGLRGGFLLNSELTDFSFLPNDESGMPVANRAGPGKRPRSSMTPTIVLKLKSSDKTTTNHLKLNSESKQLSTTKEVFASLGSPGGSAIIHFTTQTLWSMLVWNMSPQEAINQAHFALNKPNGDLILEDKFFDQTWLSKLKERRQSVIKIPLTSGIQAVEKTPTGLIGGADPRREGIVLGR